MSEYNSSSLVSDCSFKSKASEKSTIAANNSVKNGLPFSDIRDFEDAKRGFIGTIPDAVIKDEHGKTVWSMKPYDFLDSEECPDTVNPSLWRHARLNTFHGLFKVTDKVYQVRGFDISNITIIEGETSLIIIDTLLTTETAKASLELYFKHRPYKPISTVIYTHSHSDHYGGVKGIITEEEVKTRRVKVIAPSGFMESVVSENFLPGNAMKRRAQYQFGLFLKPGARGLIDCGIGKAAAHGTVSLLAPTDLIENNYEKRVIDGIEFIFQLVPGSEAPSEMLIFLPEFKLLNMAEDVTHNMHNLYAIRGVEVRDGNQWSKYIDYARVNFGNKTDILIAQHHWPTVGKDRVNDVLKKQRDMYKFIHDQTLRLVNQGYNSRDIAETLRMSKTLETEWSTRGYYGTLSHNSKAVYQRYMGWYDGNPSNLNPLPPVEDAKKTIEYMGGPKEVLARSKIDFKNGEFRWVASITNKIVFSDPTNLEARELCADALEQLGYQSEASTWRSAYLVGAMELRKGTSFLIGGKKRNTIGAVSNSLLFDFLAVRLDAKKVEGKIIIVQWNFIDTDETFITSLENCALTHSKTLIEPVDVTVELERETLNKILMLEKTLDSAITSGLLKIEGDKLKLLDLLSHFEDFDDKFPIVEPLKTL